MGWLLLSKSSVLRFNGWWYGKFPIIKGFRLLSSSKSMVLSGVDFRDYIVEASCSICAVKISNGSILLGFHIDRNKKTPQWPSQSSHPVNFFNGDEKIRQLLISDKALPSNALPRSLKGAWTLAWHVVKGWREMDFKGGIRKMGKGGLGEPLNRVPRQKSIWIFPLMVTTDYRVLT